uniref:Protein krueppel n=1 Tax=Anopheles farauti TaxID=69004 RepID=A0A182QEY4_9DIPT
MTCKICDEKHETMGSIICPETDEKMLDKIYNSTNVRVQPRKGIITPVCEYCRNRIDEYNENFKPYEKEYFLERNHSAEEKNSNQSNRLVVNNPTQCTICGKVVKSISDHMKIHSNDKKYKCTFCDKSFAQSNNLTYHLRQHTGEKPYQCELCDKEFFNKSHLKSHLKLHTDDKEFQCEYCCKRFNHLGNLNKHQRVHSGDRPYQCNYCDRSFSNISNKKSHEKRHYGEKNFSCELCSKSFYDAHHLERHSTVHRKDMKKGIVKPVCSK